ncbi:MAG: hypothetical protein AAB875_06015 [Patescibacteria group bacterium]
MKERGESRVVTTLEAEVSRENWEALQKAYKELGAESKIRPSQSFLLQSKENPNLWRIISIWEDMGTLQKLRESGETPAGILIFRAAGGEPKLEVFEAKEEF